ncbi:MAG TPA: hypothetical protein IAD16_01680 [Candidatus Fimisoma avicola]|uniref:Bypass of forespore C C-terminal domain-containing protein n=1 Tax=Candidatus Fimisoma avicola TaxID=2840826 RepID=A0A9D1I530_9FIRM|nr:hypothetical protein [Candidatus Fimisoma avicola]
MFTRQKKNYRIFVYTALVITLCLLVAALFWPKDSTPQDDAQVNAQTETGQEGQEQQEQIQDSGSDDGGSAAEQTGGSGDGDVRENDDISSGLHSYYVVRKDGSNVSVFFVDEKGNQVKLEDTDIVYDVLTPDDQKSFDEGITVADQEELAALLQDFES